MNAIQEEKKWSQTEGVSYKEKCEKRKYKLFGKYYIYQWQYLITNMLYSSNTFKENCSFFSLGGGQREGG